MSIIFKKFKKDAKIWSNMWYMVVEFYTLGVNMVSSFFQLLSIKFIDQILSLFVDFSQLTLKCFQ